MNTQFLLIGNLLCLTSKSYKPCCYFKAGGDGKFCKPISKSCKSEVYKAYCLKII